VGEIKKFVREKLIFGVLLADADLQDNVKNRLVDLIGPIDFESETIDFTYTDYYTREMGTRIKRLFLSFRDLVCPEKLSSFKVLGGEVEAEFLREGLRRVNLDPGILNLSRLILASTKDNVHRIPLAGGIYGEVTLVYMKGRFQHLFWTYPDFRTEEYQKIFVRIREIYKAQLKQRSE
jgi:hypothetical protein